MILTGVHVRVDVLEGRNAAGLPRGSSFVLRPLALPSAHPSHSLLSNIYLQDVIDEARTLRVKGDALRIERDFFIYRSLLGLKNYK